MNTGSKNQGDVLTVKDVAEYLRLSEMTVLRLTNQGIISGVKIGRQWRFRKEVILNLMANPELLSKG